MGFYLNKIIHFLTSFLSKNLKTKTINMSQSSRTYEERTSSYKKNFGPPRQFTYASSGPSRKIVSTKTVKVQQSSPGASTSRGFGGGYGGEEVIRMSRSIPVSSGITMTDIDALAESMGEEFQGMRLNEKEELKTLNSRFAGYINSAHKIIGGFQNASSSASSVVNIPIDDTESVSSKKVVVKTIETKDGKVVRQTEDIRESKK